MVLLNSWVLFGLIPLFMFYKKYTTYENSRQTKLLYTSIVFMLLALSQPAIKHSLSDEKFNSQDYIIALDASYSMQATDIKPTRYIKAKEAIKSLLLLHPKDRFTIFIFTSNALLISPPTTDNFISMQALNSINPKYILTKSTSLYNLFQTISKTSFKKKNLIIFSDGGDERDVDKLASIIKKNNITPYFVATATQKGSALKKDGKYLKNIHSSLVISKINPLLKDLANLSGGKYYELNSVNVINTLSNDLIEQNFSKQQKIKVQSYKELFIIPLIIAIILYFISITKIHQLYIFIPFLMLPYSLHASILDFYYLKNANNDFKELKYKKASNEFKNLQPSVKSYYNIATSYYKAGEYKHALSYYTRIKTSHINIKEAILYNMGNCAVKLKKYNMARRYYILALGLKDDKDALFNLNLIRNMKTKKNMMPKSIQKNSTKKKNSKQSKKDANQKKSHAKNSSNRNSQNSTNGSGGKKQKKDTGSITKKKNKTNKFQIGYKAYEIINKGYSDEKEPW